MNIFFECRKCRSRFSTEFLRCPICGGLLTANYDNLSWKPLNLNSIWRYSCLLPRNRTTIVTLGEGMTPIVEANNLAKVLGVKKLYIKDETRNPTGSFVDRGISVVVNNIEEDTKEIVCSTRGDTGASLAVYSARIKLKARIYVPRDVDLGKLYIMLLSGADVRIVPDFLTATYLAETESMQTKVVMETLPSYIEGLKTISFEIFEQLNMNIPDIIIVPVGSGALISAIWKGFEELRKLNLLDNTPRLVGVQVEGADPITMLFNRMKLEKMSAKTLARDTELFIPGLAETALEAVRRSGGVMISVSNTEIPRYIELLARTEGIIAEPSAVLSIIAISRILNSFIDADSEVLAVITGSGLRTPDVLRNLLPIEDMLRKVSEDIPRLATSRLGETKIQILTILKHKPLHGYGIKKELANRYNKNLSTATIYQHLRELENMGLVSRTRKVGKRGKVLYMVNNTKLLT
ncbi:MAG: threonine synthase [Candidatus Korarchaeota archaeon]|nr:threonine synthase [Thermoproteota archaeon]MCR8488251.1 threonine synthase [Thermoproteota archaeon]